jgi:hypothetical protein
VTGFVLLWVATVGSLDIALWRAGQLPMGVQFMSLALSRQPPGPREAVVWWWTRAFLFGFVSLMAGLFLFAAIAWIFDPWRSAV